MFLNKQVTDACSDAYKRAANLCVVSFLDCYKGFTFKCVFKYLVLLNL